MNYDCLRAWSVQAFDGIRGLPGDRSASKKLVTRMASRGGPPSAREVKLRERMRSDSRTRRKELDRCRLRAGIAASVPDFGRAIRGAKRAAAIRAGGGRVLPRWRLRLAVSRWVGGRRPEIRSLGAGGKVGHEDQWVGRRFHDIRRNTGLGAPGMIGMAKNVVRGSAPIAAGMQCLHSRTPLGRCEGTSRGG